MPFILFSIPFWRDEGGTFLYIFSMQYDVEGSFTILIFFLHKTYWGIYIWFKIVMANQY